MKNSFYLVAAFFALASCKTNNVEPTPPPPPPAPKQIVADAMIVASVMPTTEDRGVLMRNGVLMTIEDGKSVPMSKEMILQNGDKVLLNGDVIHTDGSKTKMLEGMMIDKNGMMTDKDGNKVTTKR